MRTAFSGFSIALGKTLPDPLCAHSLYLGKFLDDSSTLSCASSSSRSEPASSLCTPSQHTEFTQERSRSSSSSYVSFSPTTTRVRRFLASLPSSCSSICDRQPQIHERRCQQRWDVQLLHTQLGSLSRVSPTLPYSSPRFLPPSLALHRTILDYSPTALYSLVAITFILEKRAVELQASFVSPKVFLVPALYPPAQPLW